MSKNDIKKILIYIFLLLPFFNIPYFQYKIFWISKIYNVLLFLNTLIILVLVLINKKYSKIINYILIFNLVLLISTIVNKGEIYNCLKLIYKTIFLCLIFDYGLRTDSKNFLNSCGLLLSILIYINFISMILFPKGMYVSVIGYTENWFLGYKNIHIIYILPAILVNVLSNDKILSIKNIMLIIVSVLTLIMGSSITSIIGIIIFVICCLIKKIFDNVKIFNILNYSIGYVICFFSIIIFRIQNLFKFIIVDFFHKDLTFTGRTFIWDYVMNFISNKKVLGYGLENSTFRLMKTKIWRSFHAHNQVLEICYKTGFIGLGLFLVIVYKSFKELYINKEKNSSKTISIMIFIYLIMMITEFYSFEYILFLFVIAYDVKYIIGSEK